MTSSPKHAAPLLEALVGGEDGGAGLVAPVDELEEEGGSGAGDGDVAYLVNDEQRRVCEDLDPLLKPIRGLCLLEGGDEVGQGAVIDAPSVLGGGDGEGDGRMGLPDAGGVRGRSRSPCGRGKNSSCRASICSRLMEGWKLKSKSARVFTAGSREARMAAWSLRLLRRSIWAARSLSIASAAVTRSPSTPERMESRASRAPGSLRSAS